MPRIYVQRGSAEGYKQNLSSTLSKPLSRETIGRLATIVGPDRTLAQRIDALVNQEPSFVWGTKSRGRSEIARMRPGDLAIFVLEGTPLYYGTLSEIMGDDAPVDIRRALSKEFWGSEGWEYVWFLQEVAQTKLPRSELEVLLGQTLGSFFGSSYASFRGIDETDTAAGSKTAVLEALRQAVAKRTTTTLGPKLDPADPQVQGRKDLLIAN